MGRIKVLLVCLCFYLNGNVIATSKPNEFPEKPPQVGAITWTLLYHMWVIERLPEAELDLHAAVTTQESGMYYLQKMTKVENTKFKKDLAYIQKFGKQKKWHSQTVKFFTDLVKHNDL